MVTDDGDFRGKANQRVIDHNAASVMITRDGESAKLSCGMPRRVRAWAEPEPGEKRMVSESLVRTDRDRRPKQRAVDESQE